MFELLNKLISLSNDIMDQIKYIYVSNFIFSIITSWTYNQNKSNFIGFLAIYYYKKGWINT